MFNVLKLCENRNVESRKREHVTYRSWISRFVFLTLLLIVVYFDDRAPSVMFVPEDVPEALIPRDDALRGWLNSPWARTWDMRLSGFQGVYGFWVPRMPLVSWGARCITEDQHEVPYACPYPVFLELHMSYKQNWLPLFPLMHVLAERYPQTKVALEVSPVGAVRILLPRHRIVLGRRYWMERLGMARNILRLPDWRESRGDLDMRYPDGFAWRPWNNVDK